MVWKDQVNVLDQGRIFRLLAKGPRLDGYLQQIKRAEKLDFASWGGFAQNFAARRVPFENPVYTSYWEKLRAEDLHIPVFISSTRGPFVPGSAVKGALHTALVNGSRVGAALKELAEGAEGDRPPRNPGMDLDERAAGKPARSRLRTIAASDSDPLPPDTLRVHLLRTATIAVRGGSRPELRWKTAPSGAVEGGRPEASTPVFAEMAPVGTVFSGVWSERGYLQDPEVSRALRWKQPLTTAQAFRLANEHSAAILAVHRQYAQGTGLDTVDAGLAAVEAKLAESRSREDACVLSIGWGGGFLTKAASPATTDEVYRRALGRFPFYAKAIRSGLPFPKTRRIVFLDDKPAALPGWVLLETVGD
jgi:CRISPR-associated protein Csm5